MGGKQITRFTIALMLLSQASMSGLFCIFLPVLGHSLQKEHIELASFTQIGLLFSQGVGLLLHIVPFVISCVLTSVLIISQRERQNYTAALMRLIFAIAFFQMTAGISCVLALLFPYYSVLSK